MSPFGAAHAWGGKNVSLFKICQTYTTMMKLGSYTLTKKDLKNKANHVTHFLISADISTFSPEISNFSYIKKCKYRLHFNA